MLYVVELPDKNNTAQLTTTTDMDAAEEFAKHFIERSTANDLPITLSISGYNAESYEEVEENCMDAVSYKEIKRDK